MTPLPGAVAGWHPADLGPIVLPAPHLSPRQVDGHHGHLWQWVGAGDPVLSLTVAVRESRMADPLGVVGRLGHEVARTRGLYDDPERAAVRRDVPVLVDGGLASAAAYVDGARHGRAVRTVIVTTTDGRWLHLVQLGVRDTDAGGTLVDRLLDGISVKPWSPPR